MLKYKYLLLGLSPILFVVVSIGGIFGLVVNINSMEELESTYDFLKNSTQSTIVVYPTYTYYANEKNSLADVGTENCDRCETYMFDYGLRRPYGYSDIGGSFLPIAERYFNMTDDYIVNKHPEILDAFDRVILMRNTYVTENLRQTILSHDKVIYLFPDAMTKQINITNSTMTYIGEYEPLHSMVPVWNDDNRCADWLFVPVENGYIMTCFPDVALINNNEMLITIRDQ